jgi:hypothetical protein
MTDDNLCEEIPAGLAELRRAMRSKQPPPRVEEFLLGEFRKRQSAKKAARRGWRVSALLAAAATIVVAVLAFRPLPTAPDVVVASGQPMVTDYMPLSFSQPLYPDEFAQVVRISLPRSEMIQFGLPVYPDLESDRVMADVVLGEDGVARAIRFVE